MRAECRARVQEKPVHLSNENHSTSFPAQSHMAQGFPLRKDTGFPNQKPTQVPQEGRVGDKPRYAEPKPRHQHHRNSAPKKQSALHA